MTTTTQAPATERPDAPDPDPLDLRTPHERLAAKDAMEQIALARQTAASAESAEQMLPHGSALPPFDPRLLIPRAGQTRYVPLSELGWLEEARGRHERLARQLAVAVRAPDAVRRDHAARVAEWRGEVRAAARNGTSPPAWTATTTDSWLDGRLDTAEAEIVELVDGILALLRDAHATCEEHTADEQEHVRGWQARQLGAMTALETYKGGHMPREEVIA